MNDTVTPPQVSSQVALIDYAALMANPSLILFDSVRMHAVMRFAQVMSESVVTVPKHLHGKPSDCLAITLQAMRWRMDPYVVAGKTNVVNGNLGYEAQLVVAVLKTSGAVKGRPHYEYQGEAQALECRAAFIPAGEDELVWTEWLGISSIKVKNSPLWATNPKQQFGYLQARNWARLYAPDALLGVYTTDELELAGNVTPRGPQRRSAATPLAEEVPKGEQGKDAAAADATSTAAASTSAAADTAGADKPVNKPPAAPLPTAKEGGITVGQINYLRGKLKNANIAEQTICDRYQISGIELLTAEQFDEQKSALLAMS